MDNNLRTALMKFGIINWMRFYFVDEEGVDREEDDEAAYWTITQAQLEKLRYDSPELYERLRHR